MKHTATATFNNEIINTADDTSNETANVRSLLLCTTKFH